MPNEAATDAAGRRAFLLTSSAHRHEGGTAIELWGVLEGGGTFAVTETRAKPYFYVPASATSALNGLPVAAVTASELTSLQGEPVARVTLREPQAVARLRESLRARGVTCFEADLRFVRRHLMDSGVRAALRIVGAPVVEAGSVVRFHNPELHPATFEPRLRALALDIETSIDGEQLFGMSLAADGVREVFLRYDREVPGARVFGDERALLQHAFERIAAIDPDIITGWNVIDFDLRMLQRFAHRAGIRADLGRGAGAITFERDQTFTLTSRASLPGRQVLDAMRLVRDVGLRLDDHRLETAARHVIGRGKLIAPAGKAGEIERSYRHDPQKLAAYNLDDSVLVLEILSKLDLVELTVQRSLLTGMPLDRVGASVASFDSIYLPRLHARGKVAPSVDIARETAPIVGGHVLESVPGLHSWIVVFDYRSLYPSLMRTFNIDPLAHAQAGASSDPIVAPNGSAFARTAGILPELLDELSTHRERALRDARPFASHAIKILMNSLFGVLGTPSCRFFSPPLANAITQFGQWVIELTKEVIEAHGFTVIYGDTDSLFVVTGAESEATCREVSEQLLEHTRAEVARRIVERHRVTPRLHLTLAKLYRCFLMPELAASHRGSKKRYAGLRVEGASETLDIVGLEAVRRDSPALVRSFQRELLLKLFHHEPIEPYIRDLVARLKAGELDDQLVIHKGLGKDLLGYTRTTPPHVKAARKLGTEPTRSIRFVMTQSGPEPVREGEPLPQPIDHAYYLEKQFEPAAAPVLRILKKSFTEVVRNQRQLRLF